MRTTSRLPFALASALCFACTGRLDLAAPTVDGGGPDPDLRAPHDILLSERAVGALALGDDGTVYTVTSSSSRTTGVGHGAFTEYFRDGRLFAHDPDLATPGREIAGSLYTRQPHLVIAGRYAIVEESESEAYRVDVTSGAVTPFTKTWETPKWMRGFVSDGDAVYVNEEGIAGGPIVRIDVATLASTKLPIELPAGMHRAPGLFLGDGALLLPLHAKQEPTCRGAGIYLVPFTGGKATKVASVRDEDCENHGYMAAALHGDRMFLVLAEGGALRYKLMLARTGSPEAARLLIKTSGDVRAIAATGAGVLVCDDLRGAYVRDDGSSEPLGEGPCHSPRWRDGRAYWINEATQKVQRADLP